MSDLHVREARLPDWDEPVAEFIRDDTVVGIAYLDAGDLLVEFYGDDEGVPWVFDVEELQRALDTAAAMLGPEEDLAPGSALPEGEEHPVDVLASAFDESAVRRGPEDEGFYPWQTALRMARTCTELGLAVVSLEGFTVHPDRLEPVAGCSADLARAHRGERWPTFLAACNVQAEALLERWPRDPSFALAIEVQDAEGDRYVL